MRWVNGGNGVLSVHERVFVIFLKQSYRPGRYSGPIFGRGGLRNFRDWQDVTALLKLAAREGFSVGQFLASAASEKLAVMVTIDYLRR
jgi:hypothetical protein